MKILVTHSNNILAKGGADRFARELSKTLVKLNHKVIFLQRNKTESVFNWKGIKIYSYAKVNMIPGFGFAYPIFLRKNIKKTLIKIKEKEKNIDFILCINYLTNKVVLETFPEKPVLLRVPAVEASEVSHTWKDRTLKEKLKGKIIKNMEKKAVRNKKNKIIANSKKVKKLIKKYYQIGDVEIVKSGVDVEKFKPAKKQKKRNIIMCAGRLSPEKNFQAVIRAMKNVKGKLRIYGEGNEEENLKTLAEKINLNKKISFLNYKPNLEKYYKKAKIFVLPSKHEAFGNVIIEAFASGLPVIAFKPSKKYITASDEIIDDGGTGFLVKNEEEMAEKINLLLDNEDLRRKLSKNAVKEAKKYSWKQTANKILKTVKEL